MAKAIREKLIKLLANGEFVSGEYLGAKLGVSRAAISNHIKALSAMGLDIYKVTGKGYKISQVLNLLNYDEIVDHLTSFGSNNKVEVHTIIDSTNSYLLRKIPHQISLGQVCVAEYQQQGRGRRGRTWQSPFASHLYLSLYHPLDTGMSEAMGLSLVVALALCDTLALFTTETIQVKWPNDVYISGKKIAGILLELEGQAEGYGHCVIGIGLNVQMPKSSADKIDQPWTDLQQHTDSVINRNLLTANLIHHLNKRLNIHRKYGLASMLPEWHKKDYFLHKPVKVITGQKTIDGIYKGVNEQGGLVLQTAAHEKIVFGGEVTLRGTNERIN
jgi:BirA family biotin operon repressor/biotin-[acetyl-CoA-carboxylase] ligase